MHVSACAQTAHDRAEEAPRSDPSRQFYYHVIVKIAPARLVSWESAHDEKREGRIPDVVGVLPLLLYPVSHVAWPGHLAAWMT